MSGAEPTPLGADEPTRTPTFYRWAGGETASMLNPSGTVFARIEIRADPGNSSSSTVSVSVEGSGPAIPLGPASFPLTLFRVSPNRISVVGSTTGLVAWASATP